MRQDAGMDALVPPQNLPSLADPPAIEHLTLEQPIPLVIGLVLVSLLWLALCARRGKPHLGGTGAITGLALSAGVVLLAWSVQTPRERVGTLTRELVDLVASGDAPGVDRLLAPDARVVFAGNNAWDQDRVLAFVRTRGGVEAGVESHRTVRTPVEVRAGAGAFSRPEVLVRAAGDANPSRVIVLLSWRRGGEAGWEVSQVEPLWVQGWGRVRAGDVP